LQAKRLTPWTLNPLSYSEASPFTAIDKDQRRRIEILNEILGAPYLKYLLFCPRSDSVDNDTKIKLAYLRNKTLSSRIFDYTHGLEIYKKLLNNNESLKAGIFITDTHNSKVNFGWLHNSILERSFPFSWFIAMNFSQNHDFLHVPHKNNDPGNYKNGSDNHEIVEGILEGNKEKIDVLIRKVQKSSDNKIPENFQVLPKHRITLKCVVGGQIDPQRSKIQPAHESDIYV